MRNPENVFLDQISFEPLSSSNWGAFVQLFGEKGACGNCWCMYYRLSKADYNEGKHNGRNRDAMKELVMQGRPTGILGFYEEQPIGWCAFAPREDYIRLERSRVHKRIDQLAVWSITCFFVDKSFRRHGVSVALLKGVISYAREKGIKVIEAYPAIPTKEPLPDSFVWVGLYSAFEKVGFKIVDRTSPNRPMVRCYTDKA
ncbi:MAG: GNAT family N-acetyltransferase [Prolixibacteraceae bacterium]